MSHYKHFHPATTAVKHPLWHTSSPSPIPSYHSMFSYNTVPHEARFQNLTLTASYKCLWYSLLITTYLQFLQVIQFMHLSTFHKHMTTYHVSNSTCTYGHPNWEWQSCCTPINTCHSFYSADNVHIQPHLTFILINDTQIFYFLNYTRQNSTTK